MSESESAEIENRIFSPNFYMHDFANAQAAADYLGISVPDWIGLMQEYKTSTRRFIYAMRIEDVKEHLSRNPHERLDMLASLHGFCSRWHLLWEFFRRERCTPRRWCELFG